MTDFVKVCVALCLSLVITSTQAVSEPLKVGVIVPLSGPYANFGEAARIGIELGTEERKGIQFIYEDSQYDAVKAVSAYRKLVDIDGAGALIVLGTPPSSAIVPLAKSRNIPVFIWTASSKLSKNQSHVIRLMNSGLEQGKTMASEVQKFTNKKVAFFSAENGYARAVRDGFFTSYGKENIVVASEFTPATTDFRSSISKVLSKNDVNFGICLNTGQIPTFLKQLSEQNFKGKLFGCHAMSSPEVLKALQTVNYEAWFVEGRMQNEFVTKFSNRWPETSGIWLAAAFHDTADLLVTGVAAEKDLNKLLRTLVGRCPNNSALGRGCIENRAGDTVLATQLGTTLMKNGKFDRDLS